MCRPSILRELTHAPTSIPSGGLCRMGLARLGLGRLGLGRLGLGRMGLLLCCLLWSSLLLSACGNEAQERAKHMKQSGSEGTSSAEGQAVQPSESHPSAAPAGEATVVSGAPSEQLAPESSGASAPPSEVGRLGVVLAGALNVRSAPSGQAQRVNLLHCGDVVRIESQEGSWYQVRVDELQGWSHMAWLNPVRAGGRMPPCGRSRRADEEQLPTLPAVPSRSKAASEVLAVAPPPAEKGDVVETVQAPGVNQEKGKPEAPRGPEVVPVAKVPAELPATPQKTAAGSAAESPKAHGKGPASIALSLQGRAAKVNFPHHLHNQQFECAKCHHPVSAEAKAATPRERACRSCHLAADAKGISPVTNKDAFHNTCKNCHISSGAGPTRCAECHTSGG